MRIAYVEDNPTNFSLVERVARMAQHTVVSYTEGEIALAALKSEVFDLILMDVELAGEMNGLDLVRMLRKDGLQTPIVAVTAYAMLGDREKCIEAGCNEYLPKPLPIVDLVNTFAKYTELLKNAASKSSPASTAPIPEPATALPTPPPAAVPPAVPVSNVPATPTVTPSKPELVTPPAAPSVSTSAEPVPPAPAIKPAPTPSVPPRANTKPFTLKTDNVVDNKS